MKNVSYEYSAIKRKAEAKKKSSDKFRLNVSAALTALLAIAAACLLIKTLFVRIELTEQNDINVELEAQLNELEEEKRRLQIEYESQIDLAELEDRAENELGMQKPNGSQTIEIDTDTQDKALIFAETKDNG
ncbi:MAG: cell division protein FtsL [Oscillospiraceae bacterium]|nr:cell division protein FtsL [Oscillospiraceae bacterium]